MTPPVDRVELFKVTCPPLTAQAAAIETLLIFPPGIVREWEIVIPDGHAGVTGLALAQAHQIVIPARGANWIVSNDEKINWPYRDVLNNGAWSAFAYNTDPINPHSWYLRALVAENPIAQAAQLATILDVQDILAAGAQIAANGAESS